MPPLYANEVLADSPLAWWKLNDSTTVMWDSAGSNHGTYQGTKGVDYQQRVQGIPAGGPSGALSLNSTPGSAYCQAPYMSVFNNQSFTIEAWIAATWVNSIDTGVVGCGDSAATDDHMHMVVATSGGIAHPKLGFYSDDLTPTDVMAYNTWLHYVVAWNNSTMVQSCWINGVATTTRVSTGPLVVTTGALTGNGIQIGLHNGNYSQGTFAHVAIYGSVLSLARIQAHAAAGMVEGYIDEPIFPGIKNLDV